MIPELKAQVIETITKLPDADFEELKQYVDFLMWRSKQQPETKSDAKRILEFMRQTPKLSHEDIEGLMQSIEEGKMPVRYDSPFEEAE